MLKNYELIMTSDGSETLRSKEFDETCHNISGALAETIHVYLDGCEIADKISQASVINILEIGFGTGLGYFATYQLFKKFNALSKLNFISLEKDPELIAWSQKRLIETFQIELDHLQVLEGNARHTVNSLINSRTKFDCIYQDAFSPLKNGELWSVEWFQALKLIASEEAVLSTYSASSRARKSMIAAGWVPTVRAGFKSKGQTTTARLTGSVDIELQKKLAISHVDAIYDCNL
jgi:tRNA U34 5-methylaminomethyl-2-thiouridine-forming methyltransferase MnmC